MTRRIAFFITLPELGGAQSHVRAVLGELAGRDYDVTVLSAGEGWLLDEARALGFSAVPLRHLQRALHPLRDWRAFLELLGHLRRLRPDVLHLHSSKAGILGRLAGRFAGVPNVIFTAHGFSFHERLSPLKLRAAVALERVFARLCHRIVAVSRYDAARAARFAVGLPGQVTVVYNGIPLHAAPPAGRQATREALGLGPEAEVVIMVARFSFPKDHATLLAALEPLMAERPNLTCLLVGTGRQEAETHAAIAAAGLAERVRCLGDRQDVPALLAASDVFVLSSQFEGLPISILEGMAAGLPVVASDVGGVSEEVLDGVTGRLVPARDPERLAAALRELLADPALARRMGDAGARRVQECFSAEAMGEALRTLYAAR